MEKLEQLWLYINNINAAYDRYAKNYGLTYNQIYVLELIKKRKELTQKEIADTLLLPKQRVSSIVTKFYNSGYLLLTEDKNDRRNKFVKLSAEGDTFIKKIMADLESAESNSFNSLTKKEQDSLIYSMKKYTDSLNHLLNSDK